MKPILVAAQVALLVTGTACTGNLSAPPEHRALSEKSLALAASPTAGPKGGIGQPCPTGEGTECESGWCLKTGIIRKEGYFCTAECATEKNCPLDWSCRQPYPEAPNRWCVPPENWNGHKVEVRP